MEREQGERWGHPNPLLWSSSWGETAPHTISCWSYSSTKGPGRYFTAERVVSKKAQEPEPLWTPLGERWCQDLAFIKLFYKNSPKWLSKPNRVRANSCTKLQISLWNVGLHSWKHWEKQKKPWKDALHTSPDIRERRESHCPLILPWNTLASSTLAFFSNFSCDYPMLPTGLLVS